MKLLSRMIAFLLVLSLAGCAAAKPDETSSANGEWEAVTVKDVSAAR